MPLSPDQTATLQLLLERGQSYADLAELLGVEVSEVRARARAALTELGGVDPDREVALTDYLVGEADPIERADVVRHLRTDRDDHELAIRLCEALRDLYPEAQLPRLPGSPRRPRRARGHPSGQPAAAAGAATGPAEGVSLSQRQARTVALLGAGAVLLVAVVLAITGVFAGDDGSEEPVAGTTSEAASESGRIQRVSLRAPGGGDATGEAVFGLATDDQPYVDFEIRGLDPAPQGQTYVIWLLLTGTQGYPLSPIAVTPEGTFSDRFPIPSAVLAVVARVRFVDVSIAPVGQIRKLVRDAIENTNLVLEKPGETVLEGEIPRAGAAQQGG